MSASFLRNSIRTLAVAAVLAGSAVQAADLKIGYVDTQRVVQESNLTKAADQRLKGEFSKRERELQELAAKLQAEGDKFQKDLPVLGEADRAKRQRDLADLDRDFKRREREFKEDLNLRRNQELSVIVERANKAIARIAASEKYDLIVQDAVYASDRANITARVLQAINSGN